MDLSDIFKSGPSIPIIMDYQGKHYEGSANYMPYASFQITLNRYYWGTINYYKGEWISDQDPGMTKAIGEYIEAYYQ